MRIYFGIILYAVFITLSSQSWTWEQCVEYTLKNNANLKVQEISMQKQSLSLKSAQYSFLPGVSAGGGFSASSGNSIDPSTNIITNAETWGSSYNIGASLGLFEGFARLNRLKFERYNLNYYEGLVERSENDLSFEVINTFSMVLFYEGMNSIVSDQMEISRQTWYKSQRMFELGMVAQSNVIESEAQLATDSLNAIQIEIQLKTQFLALKRLMNYPLFDSLEIDDIPFEDMLISNNQSQKEVIETAKNNLPQVNMLNNSLMAAKVRLAQVKGYALPSLSMSAGWGSGYYSTKQDTLGNRTPFNDQLEGNSRKNIGLSLSIPIFNRFSNLINIKRAKLDYEAAQIQFEDGIRQEEFNIYSNIMELDAAKKSFQAAMKNRNMQYLAFQTAENQLEKGLIDLIAFNIVKNRYAQAQINFLRSKLELFINAKTIQFYLTGKII